MDTTAQSAINVIVQSLPNSVNILKDIILPFFSVLLGALVGGFISYKLSRTTMKTDYKISLLNEAYKTINRIEDATFFLALNYNSKEHFENFFENFKLFKEFFSTELIRSLINKDVSSILEMMSEIYVQEKEPGIDFVKQCFALQHELNEIKKIIDKKRFGLFMNL